MTEWTPVRSRDWLSPGTTAYAMTREGSRRLAGFQVMLRCRAYRLVCGDGTSVLACVSKATGLERAAESTDPDTYMRFAALANLWDDRARIAVYAYDGHRAVCLLGPETPWQEGTADRKLVELALRLHREAEQPSRPADATPVVHLLSLGRHRGSCGYTVTEESATVTIAATPVTVEHRTYECHLTSGTVLVVRVSRAKGLASLYGPHRGELAALTGVVASHTVEAHTVTHDGGWIQGEFVIEPSPTTAQAAANVRSLLKEAVYRMRRT